MDNNSIWASPPSVTILRLAYNRNINIHLLRMQLGMDVDGFVDLIHDRIQVDNKLLDILSRNLGGSIGFWKNRYDDYFNDLNISNQTILANYSKFLSSLSKNRNISVESLLDDFKVSSLEHLVSEYYHNPKIMFSKDQRIEPSPVKLADWIRRCEIMAEKVIFSSPIGIFSRDSLIDILPQVVSFSKMNSIEKVTENLKKVLLEAGVVLILSPSETGHGVSGFTKSLLKMFRLVVVTDRYKNNAAFWFTLLHELSHCILHKISEPLIHYSDSTFKLASLPGNYSFEEDEANDYAENILFDPELMQALHKINLSYNNVIRLGVQYDISPSLLVAQMHRMEIAPYSYLRKVFRPVRFDTIF